MTGKPTAWTLLCRFVSAVAVYTIRPALAKTSFQKENYAVDSMCVHCAGCALFRPPGICGCRLSRCQLGADWRWCRHGNRGWSLRTRPGQGNGFGLRSTGPQPRRSRRADDLSYPWPRADRVAHTLHSGHHPAQGETVAPQETGERVRQSGEPAFFFDVDSIDPSRTGNCLTARSAVV